MSEQHVKRLATVRDEFFAAAESVEYCLDHYDSIVGRNLLSDPISLERAQENLETTYYVRMVAEVENMLYRNLTTNFPHLPVPLTAGGRFLLGRVRNNLHPRQQNSRLGNRVVVQAEQVFQYRNRLAHGGRTSQEEVSFAEALRRLSELVRRLPPIG